MIVSDYGYGIMTPRITQAIAFLQRETPKVLIVDSKGLSAYRPAGPTAVKPNYEEAVRLLGLTAAADPVERVERIALDGERLLEITGAQIAAVTIDTKGALIIRRNGSPYRTYAKPATHSMAAGAGDTFVSAFALALAAAASDSG